MKHRDKALSARMSQAVKEVCAVAQEWFDAEPEAVCAGGFTSDEILIVLARGKRAKDIADVLEDAGLLRAQRRETVK